MKDLQKIYPHKISVAPEEGGLSTNLIFITKRNVAAIWGGGDKVMQDGDITVYYCISCFIFCVDNKTCLISLIQVLYRGR